MSSAGRVLSPFVIIALIVGGVAGLGVEYALTQPTIQRLNVTVDSLQANVTASRATIDQLRSENSKLEVRLNSTEIALSIVRQNLSAKELELSKTQQRLELIQTAISKLDNDRILLGDLRKDTPSTREDARIFWQGVRSRAVGVDATLGVDVEDILSKLDNWFDWLPRINNATTFEEFGRLYNQAVIAGAFDYFDAITKFQQDALLVVITHLNQAIDLVS